MFSSLFELTALIHSAGGVGHLPSMPASRAETQEPMSPTTGATISTLLSISLGSMSIWMNFFECGSPQVLPLPCDSSQLRRVRRARLEIEDRHAVAALREALRIERFFGAEPIEREAAHRGV